MNIDKKKFFENFIDIKNIANINILKCYKVLFSKKGIKGNIGSYVIILFIMFHFIFTLLLYNKNLNIIKNIIKDIIFGITNWKLVKDNEMKKSKIKIGKEKKMKEEKISKKDKLVNPIKRGKAKDKKIVINNYSKFVSNNKYVDKNKSVIPNSKNELSKKESIIQKTREIMAFNDEEMNQLSYDLALKYDNRTCCEYYNSLIKTKHNLIFS